MRTVLGLLLASGVIPGLARLAISILSPTLLLEQRDIWMQKQYILWVSVVCIMMGMGALIYIAATSGNNNIPDYQLINEPLYRKLP